MGVPARGPGFKRYDDTRTLGDRTLQPKGFICPSTHEIYYTEEEELFLKAIRDYQKRLNRKFPTYHELLGVWKGLLIDQPYEQGSGI